jgi:hypothetical protein
VIHIRSLAEQIAAVPAKEADQFLAGLSDVEAAALRYDWSWWGRPDQFEPAHPALGANWSTWLILEWPNGGIGSIFNATEPEQFRGPQFDGAWCLTGDTSVLMADGSEKQLIDIERGDVVTTRSGARMVLAHA